MAFTEVVPPDGTVARIMRDQFHYAAAIRVGDTIVFSGMTGARPDLTFAASTAEQVTTAFANITRVLGAADRTWDDVVVVRSFHLAATGVTSIPVASLDAVADAMAELMPRHLPVWTAIGVAALGIPGMLIEIEVMAQA